MERRLSIVRVVYKFLITAAFVFDKKAESSGEIGIICAALCFFIVYKRCTAALIFRKSVFYAMILYESSTAILFFSAGIHNLSKTRLNITTLAVLIAICLIFSFAMILGQEWRK
jgi:Kef-type K+ transport system membrane component KefB